MNVLVVGFGSIGQRHARLYRELGCSVGIVTRRLSSLQLNEYKGFKTLETAIKKSDWDIIVISNMTSEHHETLKKLSYMGYTGDILVEKPMFSAPIILSGLNKKRIFVAYNLRFHPLIEELRELLKCQKILSVNMYVGQYLPTWRPGRDYTENYSASKAQGGGVLRDLSHEIDLMQFLFGSWKRLTAIGGKYSHLNGDSDDLFSLLIETEQSPMVHIHMNYLDRINQRMMVINTEQFTIKLDMVKGTLQLNQEKILQIQLDRDETYKSQHIAMINRDYRLLCTYEEGLEVVKIINAAEKAANERIWVYANNMYNLC